MYSLFVSLILDSPYFLLIYFFNNNCRQLIDLLNLFRRLVWKNRVLITFVSKKKINKNNKTYKYEWNNQNIRNLYTENIILKWTHVIYNCILRCVPRTYRTWHSNTNRTCTGTVWFWWIGACCTLVHSTSGRSRPFLSKMISRKLVERACNTECTTSLYNYVRRKE